MGAIAKRVGLKRPPVLVSLVWVIGLVSTVYLLANALYLTFLAVIFGSTPHTSASQYVAFVAMMSIPAFCFAAIGIAGLLLWPSERFWVFGLSAVLVETILALYVFAKPESMLILSDVF